METHNPLSDPEASGRTDGAPNESLCRYFVEFRNTIHDPVGIHYDITVTVPLGTTEKTIVHTAAEVVATHVPTVSSADLEVACTWLDEVCFDAPHRDALPAQLATIECPERIQYRHDGKHCEGTLVDVCPGQADTSIEAEIIATSIGGVEPAEDVTHHVPLSAIIGQAESPGR